MRRRERELAGARNPQRALRQLGGAAARRNLPPSHDHAKRLGGPDLRPRRQRPRPSCRDRDVGTPARTRDRARAGADRSRVAIEPTDA